MSDKRKGEVIGRTFTPRAGEGVIDVLTQRLVTATGEHEQVYQDFAAVLRKHEHLDPKEMLAVVSNMVGKLIALQDMRTITPAIALKIVETNIEKGNAEMIAEVKRTGGKV